MPAKRVVLLTSHSVFAAGVRRLLQDSGDLDLTTVRADDPEWMAQVGQLAPAVIVMDSTDRYLDQGAITRILGERPRARVVAINLNHGGIDVYRRSRVHRTDLSGLLEAIQGRKPKAQQTD